MNADEFRAEAERLRGIRTEIRERYPDVRWPNVESTGVFLGDTLENIERQKDIRAIVGSFMEDRSDQVRYCIASEQYKIAPHEVCVHNLEAALQEAELKEFGQPQLKVLTYNSGAVLKVTVKFPEVEFLVRDGDAVKPQAMMYNSHDMTKRVTTMFGALQQICTNGLVAWRLQKKIGQKHRLNLDVPHIVAQLVTGLTDFSEQTGLWQRWAQRELNKAEWDILWEALPFSKTKEVEDGKESERGYRNQILDTRQTGTGHTIRGLLEANNRINMWDAHSIITQFVTHNIDSPDRQLDYSQRVAAAFHKFPLN